MKIFKQGLLLILLISSVLFIHPQEAHGFNFMGDIKPWITNLVNHNKVVEEKDNINTNTNTSWVKDFLATHPEYKEEDIVLRDEKSIHFKRPDGQIEAQILQNPINYKDNEGQWKTLDTAITTSNDSAFDYQNITNSFQTYFSSDAYQEKGNIKLVKGDAELTIKTIDELTFTDRDETLILSDLAPKIEKEKEEKRGVVDKEEPNKICYPKLYEKEDKTIDVCYIVKEGRIQEQLILNKYQGYPELTQTISLKNAYAKKEGKQIVFYHTKTNEVLWYILDPVIYEQNEREDPETKMPTKFENYDLHYKLDCNIKNTTLGKCSNLSITKILEPKAKEYLADPQRQYPVTIDPDFLDSTADGYIYGWSQTYATARITSGPTYAAGTYITLGQFYNTANYYYSIYRMFLVFDTSAIPDGDIVSQVNMKLTGSVRTAVNFDIIIKKQDWSAQNPLSADNKEAAYDGCLAAANDDNIWRNTNGLVSNTQYASGNLATSWVNKAGNTYYSLISSRDISASPPGYSEADYYEYAYIDTQEHATAGYRPVLTVLYVAPSPPNTPTLDLPTDGATSQLLNPVLKTTATDAESDYLRYKIQLCTDQAMTANCQTFDQTSSPTGWSGQDTETSTAYTSGTQGIYTVQSALNGLTTYYWKSYAIDPGGNNTWSSTQGTPYSFTTKISDCSSVPFTGNFSLTSTCAFSGTLNGVDTATSVDAPNTAKLTIGTVETPGSLSVLVDQTVVVGSLELINGNITIFDGSSIKIGAPIYGADADGDGIPSSDTSTQYLTSAVNRARRGLGIDTNDNSSCPDGSNPAGICNKCVSGDKVDQISSEDLNSDCAAGYNACSGNNKIGPDGLCSGTGESCKTNGLSTPCSTKGLCQTGGGCSAGSCVPITDQSPGGDLYSDCAAGPYTCSGNNKVGPDGLCNGSGACNTGGYSLACSTARGICQIAGGCWADTCQSPYNQPLNHDTYDECTATSPTCSGNNLISGASGYCNGSGACDAGGSSSACPTRGKCQTGGGCSGGDAAGPAACVPVTTQSSGDDLYDECATGLCTTGNCSGTSTQCNKLAAGTLCRASAGVCDSADSCNGTLRTCADVKSSSECRASAGVCDSADSCNGVNNTCPADIWSNSLCRAAAGICDVAEYCSGAADCPANAFLPNGNQSCGTCMKCTGSAANCANYTGSGYGCATYCSAGACCTAYVACPTACRTTTATRADGYCGTHSCPPTCATSCAGGVCQ